MDITPAKFIVPVALFIVTFGKGPLSITFTVLVMF